MKTGSFDPNKAYFNEMFRPFYPDAEPVPLAAAGLERDAEILVFELNGIRAAFDLVQMCYHHIAQGKLNGRDFIVSFCGVCNSAMGFYPEIDGVVHRFRPNGLYNGLIMLRDDETGTYWNHISGEAMYGPLLGRQLTSFPVELTTVQAELDRSKSTGIFLSKLRFFNRLFTRIFHRGRKIDGRGHIPWFFYPNMQKQDKRLAKLEQGLGVIINDRGKFYPVKHIKTGITDEFQGQQLTLSVDETDKVPRAIAADGSRPIQLLTRWYGFSLTYPGCEVYP